MKKTAKVYIIVIYYLDILEVHKIVTSNTTFKRINIVPTWIKIVIDIKTN